MYLNNEKSICETQNGGGIWENWVGRRHHLRLLKSFQIVFNYLRGKAGPGWMAMAIRLLALWVASFLTGKGTIREVKLISSRKHSLILPPHTAIPLSPHKNMSRIGCGRTWEKQGFELPILLRTREYLSRVEPGWPASSKTHTAWGLYTRAQLLSGCVAILWRPLGPTQGSHDRWFIAVQTRGQH